MAAVVAACLAVLHAQQTPPPKPAQPSQQPPTFRSEARLVRVDAYVTAAGSPVEGLQAGDFDVLEDNVRQKVESFEYVRRGAAVEAGRRAAPGEPERRGRLFVLFVDTYHLPWVDRDVLEHRQRLVPNWQMEPMRVPVVPPPIPGDRMFRDALKEVVNKVVGDDDRVAVLTPDMWAASLTFMERQAAVDELSTRNFQPYASGQRPPEANHFEPCFPQGPDIEPEMRVRYRMWRTFSALQELVANLELLREERKAVLLVTRGWDPPTRIMFYRDPRSGVADDTVCHEERFELADVDFEAWDHTITDAARRSNVSFYSVYAHPLLTYGQPNADIDEDTRRYQSQWGDWQKTIAPEVGRDARMNRPDGAMLYNGFPAIVHDRMMWHETLKDLSKDTNGRAILTRDDFESGLKDIADSLSSYYLLGYYSTNTKRDGKFRKITVNVNRKGVSVRARPGYRAVIPAESVAAEIASRPETTVPPAINAALGPLARMRTDVPFYLTAVPEWDQASGGWKVRVVGEIDAERARDATWRSGWRVELTTTAGGKPGPGADVSVKAGQSTFSTLLPSDGAAATGDHEVRAKAYAGDNETVFDARAAVAVPAASIGANDAWLGRPLLSRRQNAPRTQFQPTADQRFSRREVLLVEVPVAVAAQTPVVRLIDRQGQPLGTPLPVTLRDRAGGRIAAITLPLANVAPGDYVIEVAPPDKADNGKVYVAFRVVP